MIDARTLVAQAGQFQSNDQENQKPTSDIVRKLFLLMHGAYGNAFMSKFSTGEKDTRGKDKGIRAAMLVWDAKLAEYPAHVIDRALSKLHEHFKTFPPGLFEFDELCKSMLPPKSVSFDDFPKLPPPKDVSYVQISSVGDGKDWARMIIAKHEAGGRISQTCVEFAKMALRQRKISDDDET